MGYTKKYKPRQAFCPLVCAANGTDPRDTGIPHGRPPRTAESGPDRRPVVGVGRSGGGGRRREQPASDRLKLATLVPTRLTTRLWRIGNGLAVAGLQPTAPQNNPPVHPYRSGADGVLSLSPASGEPSPPFRRPQDPNYKRPFAALARSPRSGRQHGRASALLSPDLAYTRRPATAISLFAVAIQRTMVASRTTLD